MAQQARSTVVMAMIENTDGVVYSHGIPTDGIGSYFFFTTIPSFYDVDLLMMDIKLTAAQYGDAVKTTLPWTLEDGYYFKNFTVYNYEFTIAYNPKNQTVWYLLKD